MAFERDDNQADSEAAPEKAAHGRPRRRFATRTQFSSAPMSSQDFGAAEEILARLVARAYVADHPELFRRREGSEAGRRNNAPDSA